MQTLLFSVVDELTPDLEKMVVESLQKLLTRNWEICEPELIDSTDSTSCTQLEDEPIRTLGVYIELQAPGLLSPSAISIEESQLADVDATVKELSKLTRTLNVTVEVEFQGEFVGEIKQGKPDHGIQKTLINEWRKAIESAKSTR